MQFPDASKPTAAVFLSFTQSNAETIVTTYQALKNLNQGIRLNLLVTQKDMNWLASNNTYCPQSNNSREIQYRCQLIEAIADKSIVNLIFFSRPENERYLQDYLQFYSVDGKTTIFPIVNGYETEDFFDPSGKILPKYSIANDVANACEIPQSKLSMTKIMGSSETMGGNLESMPGNIIMLGTNTKIQNIEKMSDAELEALLRKNYPATITDAQVAELLEVGKNSIITAKQQRALLNGLNVQAPDTNLTLSGHADEVFSIVKSNAKCGYTVLMPSSDLALQMLASETIVERKEKCLSTGGPSLKPSFPNDPSKLSDHVQAGCVGFRGLTYSEILQDQEFIALNKELELTSQKNERLIRNAIKSQCAEPDILKLPYLIKKAPWGENELITPNPVNALVITPFDKKNSIYINNPTFVKSFDEYIGREMSKRQIEMHLVLDSDYFFGLGGLHCGSSTIQICR
ncbi:MAG: hypothetical protein H7235_08830 [Bdellovibrionaceae bacterium]|nr:hypothetical protein [Pseudobdellovibrionaceae bacterium]